MKQKKPSKAGRLSIDELVVVGRDHVERGELAEAEARYREALALDPDHLGVLTLLAVLLVDRDKPDEAIDLLEHARELGPGFPPVQLALGAAYAAAGHDELAVAAMEIAIKLDTESTLPMERLAKHHIIARRPREAIGLLRRILRRDPTNAHAQFFLAGLAGSPSGPDDKPRPVASPPPELIADLFDTYAASFDQHLVENLRYGVPKSLAALLADVGVAADSTARVLDLGCGTGLAGIELRPYARTLIGSDLSPRMIVRARQRGVYDELLVEDLLVTLARENSSVDVIVAADVFIYVGMLEATFAAVASALRPGGRLAFSIEKSASEDVVLQTSLRYAHAADYITRLARDHELSIERTEPTVLRVDNEQPVDGSLYILRR